MSNPIRVAGLGLASILMLVSLNAGCKHEEDAWNCEKLKTEEEKRDCRRDMTIYQLIASQRPGSASTPSSSQSVNFIEDSAFVSNDTFVLSQSVPLPGSLTIQAVSGKINAADDIDIYVLAYTGGGSGNYLIDVSKPTTSSVCAAYTSFGPSGVATGTPDGSLVSAGTMTANVSTITLDLSSRTHLYIRCSGTLNETYSLRFAYSSLNK